MLKHITGMNITYILFSLNRYILVANLKEITFFKHVSNLNMKKYVSLLLVSCVLLNLFTLMPYELMFWYSDTFEFPLEIYNEYNEYTYTKYLEPKSKCKIFESLKLFSKSFNSIFLFILNFGIDVFMLKSFTREIDHKIEIRSYNADNSDLIKKKKKINRMVMTNCTIFFFAHAPEFLMSVLLIVFKKKISQFCGTKLACDLLNKEAEFFNIISIMLNFYVFLIFDKNFQESFEQRKENLLSNLGFKIKKWDRFDGYSVTLPWPLSLQLSLPVPSALLLALILSLISILTLTFILPLPLLHCFLRYRYRDQSLKLFFLKYFKLFGILTFRPRKHTSKFDHGNGNAPKT